MTNSIKLSLLSAGQDKTSAALLARSSVTTAKSAVPVVLAPNGTVATNGTITLGTALPIIYASAWVRLPAGAVVGGLAGLYYVVFSSTTVGQVYTAFADPATAFSAFIPTTLVAAVGSNAAYTAATAADVTLTNITLPAGTLGENGSATVWVLASNNGTAGAKNVSAKLDGSKFLSADVTTSVTINTEKTVTNRGTEDVQLAHANHINGAISTVAITRLAVNTRVTKAIAITAQVAVATDYVVLEAYSVEVQSS